MTAPAWGSERSRNGGVDEVPVDRPGRLFLCGKHFIGPDHEAAIARLDADVVVCLNEYHEIEERYPAYMAHVRAGGPGIRWWAIPDLSAPPVAGVRSMAVEIDGLLSDGKIVLVHCGAGIGRAGTLAAAVLVVGGATVTSACEIVADARPMAGPEAGRQLEALHELAAHDA